MIQMKTLVPLQKTTEYCKSTTDNDLLTRTSWADAKTALSQINKGKASGNKAALWLRSKIQIQLFQLGCFIQRNAGKVLFVGILILSSFCVGLKTASMETNVERLWVEEGGRLEKEQRYIRNTLGEGAGSTNQLLVQTPRVKGGNILQSETLLVHLEAALEATRVTVDLYDSTWSLKDLCYSPTIPDFDTPYLNSLFEKLFPCALITPLDCFWEGSKLLGPDIPLNIPGFGQVVQWTSLNPQWLSQTMKNFGSYVSSFPFHTLEDFMKRAGITTAYQEKPCLNPHDDQCPETAPNKKSKQTPDIGAELTGGCYGFATRYMHWPEDMIIGGVIKNKTGHIIKGEALQTIIQLMGEREMFEYWKSTYKTHNLDWSLEKAKIILEKWQRKFSQTMEKFSQNPNITKSHFICSFSTVSLTDILKGFSEINVKKLSVGYVVMLIYAYLSLFRWSEPFKSQSGVGIAGVILIVASIASGLGFCALIGIVFNASTTQIVPFFALGLGMNDMFLLAHTYAENASCNILHENQTGECLKRTGISVVLTSVINMCAFFIAAIVPIPALRSFVLQIAILVLFNLVIMLLVFPAILSLDLRRRNANRVDILCCFNVEQLNCIKAKKSVKSSNNTPTSVCNTVPGSPKRQAVAHALPPDCSHVVTVLVPPHRTECWTENNNSAPSVENLATTNSVSTKELIKEIKPTLYQRLSKIWVKVQKDCCRWSLTWLAVFHYIPILQKASFKVQSVIVFLIFMAFSIWGVVQIDDGLDLTDIVPYHTNEYQFLSIQKKYFGFFNMFAVTQGNFEYPTNQKLLYEYHETFTRIDNIIKNDDGGLPEFWLLYFRDWLRALQTAFDQDWKNGCITQERWYKNASDEGILAYKLLVQTGRVDNPIDKSLVMTIKLVDENGIINPKAFYNYLTAWASNDALAYSASQANLRPEPRQWIHDRQDVELKIPKSQPLIYTQMPFYLNKMAATNDITATIEEIRKICHKFQERGLPNFPTGIPFIYWEQYIGLRFYLLLAFLCVLLTVFLVLSVILFNPWAASIVVFVISVMDVELFGLMGILGIKFSAVPAVILIVAIGIGVEFTVHILIGFLTSIGNRNQRIGKSLEYMFCPVVHGTLSSILGVMMLAFSEFDFIVRYFFYVLLALMILGSLNGLLFFPILLSILGPPGEIIPHDDPNRISTPTPEPSPLCERIQRSRPFKRRIYPRINSEISLSTISEEQGSCHSSHEIIVEPEVVVETTTVTNTQGTVNSTTSSKYAPTQERSQSQCSSSEFETSSCSSPSSTTSDCPSLKTQTSITTRVKATAKVKVEVHTPLPGATERENSFRHKRHRRSSYSE